MKSSEGDSSGIATPVVIKAGDLSPEEDTRLIELGMRAPVHVTLVSFIFIEVICNSIHSGEGYASKRDVQ